MNYSWYDNCATTDELIQLRRFSFTELSVTLQNIISAPSKSCPDDLVPTQIFKDFADELLPVISIMVNLSLKESHFPDNWKEVR